MNLLRKMELNKDNLIIYNKNELVVIYNKELGKHIILSEEVYNYFEIASTEKLTIEEFIEKFKNEEDKRYIKQAIINMIKIGAIYEYEDYKKNIGTEIHSEKSIYMCITNRCNLRCKHCCSNCSDKEKDFLGINQIRNVVDIIKDLNPEIIILTGGEPLVRKDFKEIISYIRETMPNIYLVLSTNGTLINDLNIDFIIKSFNRIDISVDGIDEETCSVTRGKGIFNKILSVVKKLQEREFKNISLSMVFGDKNENLREKFEELNKSLKTTPIDRYFIPEGRGRENISQYLSENAVLPMNIPKMLCINNDKRNKKISSCSCNALKSQIFINYDGNIYPCPSLLKDEYRIGSIFDANLIINIKNKDFKNINAYKKIQEIYPYNFKKCKDCNVNIFCWQCPALLDSAKDNDKEFDKWCELMKVSLSRIVWDEKVV